VTLPFGDPKVSVDVDQMDESELPGEAVGSTEGLSCESSQVIDMLWCLLATRGFVE
jgi:hypothetical protein